MATKKIISLSGIVAVFLCAAARAQAVSISITNPLSGVSDTNDILANIISFAQTIIIPLAALAILYAGFLFMSSAGNPEKVLMAKKIIVGTLAGISITLIAEQIPDIIDSFGFPTSVTSETDILSIFTIVTDWVKTLVYPAVALAILYGGFLFMTSGGDPENVTKGRMVVTYAVIGLAVTLLADSVTSIISSFDIPSITTKEDIETLLGTIKDYMDTLIYPLAALAILYGAYLLITSGGDEKATTTGRKVLTYAVIGILITFLSQFLIDFVVYYDLPGIASKEDLVDRLNNMLAVVTMVVYPVAVLAVIYGAFKIMTAGDNEQSVTTGRKAITYAVIGIVVALTSSIAVDFVDSFGIPTTYTASSDVVDLIMLFVTFFLQSIIPAAAVLMVLYGAYLFMTAGGNPQSITSGRKVITYAVVGYLLAVSANFVLDLVYSFDIPGTVTTTGDVSTFITSLVSDFLKPVLNGIAILGFLYGASIFMTAGDNAQEVGRARKIIIYSAVGMGIAMLSDIIINYFAVSFAPPTSVSGPGDALTYLTDIITFVRDLLLPVSSAAILYGGFTYMTATGDPNKLQRAKQIVFWAIIGLLVTIVSEGVVLIIESYLAP
jgi:hypothetical protein